MTRAIVVFLAACALVCAQPRPGTEAEAHVAKGTKLLQEELVQEAASEFQAALKLDPNLSRARFQYAACLVSLGRNEEARKEFERVQQQLGPAPPVTYYLGRLDLLNNDFDAAVKKLSSIAANPPYPDTAFHLGVAYISAGDKTAGTKWLEKAAKLTPRDYRVHYRLARAYSSLGRESEAAREYDLYTTLRDDRRRTEKTARACTEALRTQPLDQARTSCRPLTESNDFEKLLLAGQLYGGAGAFSDALEPLDRAARLDPGSFEVWHNLGVTYFRLQRPKEARAALEKAVAIRPDFVDSTVLLAGVLYMLGDDEAALPVLERASRLRPNDPQIAGALRQLQESRRKK